MTQELNAKGVHVVWLGLPIPDGPGFKKSFPIVNGILESVVAAHPKTATYVDTWHILADVHGRYAPYLRVHGKLTLMRLPDGVHYTAAAGDLIAQQVLKQLRGTCMRSRGLMWNCVPVGMAQTRGPPPLRVGQAARFVHP